MPRLSGFGLARCRAAGRSRTVPAAAPLMVTLLITVLRDRPATKPVRPARAPLERPRMSIGAFTAAEVMLTMRPNFRAIMPSTVALISSMGVSMLASMRLDPVVAGPVAEIAGRRAAGIVDQDIRIGTGLQHGLAAGRGRDVADHLGHGQAGMVAADFGGGLGKRLGAARRQRDMHALVGERDGAGASQSLARCADDGAAALDSEIHCDCSAGCRNGAGGGRSRAAPRALGASRFWRASQEAEEHEACQGLAGLAGAVIKS